MVEVIHRMKTMTYPFGLDKTAQNTFLEVIQLDLTEQSIGLVKHKNTIYKEMQNKCEHFIHLVKVLKEDNSMHMRYEYLPKSYESFISEVAEKHQGKISQEKYLKFIQQIHHALDHIISSLIQAEIKSDLNISNLAVDLTKSKPDDPPFVKIYIDSESEFLSVLNKNSLIKSKTNQQLLIEFYQAEKKRLNLEIEEILEKYFGKIAIQILNSPNFVINGTKLVFLQEQKYEEAIKNIEKHQIIPPENNSKKTVTSANHQKAKQQERQKNSKRIEQIKQNISHLTNRMTSQGILQQPAAVGFPQQILDHQKGKNSEPIKVEVKPAYQKIEDFNKSFDPQFKPEEFTKENTFVCEENEYLECLEAEIQKLKKKEDEYKSSEMAKQKGKKNEEDSGKNEQNNKSANRSMNSNNDSYEKQSREEKTENVNKPEKVNKYKMKIITSHEIEIEGDSETNMKDIEKDIIENIRNGKININDLSGNAIKQNITATAITESPHHSKDYSNNLSRNSESQNSKEESNPKEDNHKPEIKKLTQIHKKKEEAKIEAEMAPVKSINEIIEKIGIKTNVNCNSIHLSKPASLSIASQFQDAKHEESGGMSNLIHNNMKIDKHLKEEKMMKEQKDEKEEMSSKGHLMNEEKTKGSIHEDHPIKKEHANIGQNYYEKIKEAKSKAEQVLKEYGKSKKN